MADIGSPAMRSKTIRIAVALRTLAFAAALGFGSSAQAALMFDYSFGTAEAMDLVEGTITLEEPGVEGVAMATSLVLVRSPFDDGMDTAIEFVDLPELSPNEFLVSPAGELSDANFDSTVDAFGGELQFDLTGLTLGGMGNNVILTLDFGDESTVFNFEFTDGSFSEASAMADVPSPAPLTLLAIGAGAMLVGGRRAARLVV